MMSQLGVGSIDLFKHKVYYFRNAGLRIVC